MTIYQIGYNEDEAAGLSLDQVFGLAFLTGGVVTDCVDSIRKRGEE